MVERLIAALRALAAPAEVQLARFPPFVAHADELALDFDDAFRLVNDCPQIELTQAQRDALNSIDSYLSQVSGAQNADYWTESALRTAPAWTELRLLAVDALRHLGAPVEPVPPSDATYVRGNLPNDASPPSRPRW